MNNPKTPTVLVVGGGAREHALCWSIGRSHPDWRVLCTPGNGGICPTNRFSTKDSDLLGIVRLAKDERVDLVVIGPEGPLVAGLADLLRQNGIQAFGPSAAAAQLEGSKIFTKTCCKRWSIPTARFNFASSYETAAKIIRRDGFRVIKADGLCGGKGVIVADTEEQMLEAAYQFMVAKVHGKAGASVLLEDKLVGRECSVMAFCDGEDAVLLPPARDYKRAFNGDNGPNTGGMGSYSPLPDVNDDMLAEIKERIIMPTLRGMAERDTPYHGLLYAGIMLTEDGPMLLEYNVRFGDPETQVVLARVESDIAEYMLACATPGGLEKLGPLQVKDDAAVCIVLASSGYPGKYETGYPISGTENVPEGVLTFHAGTNRTSDAELVTSGGRVTSVVGLRPSIEQARQHAELGADAISFENKFHRNDIALGVA